MDTPSAIAAIILVTVVGLLNLGAFLHNKNNDNTTNEPPNKTNEH